MKKIGLLLIGALILVGLVGCSSNDTVDKKDDEKVQGSVNTSEDVEAGFGFETNGININMHEKANDILTKLGKELDYFESTSCAFPGLDKVYTYSSYEVTTYPNKSEDHIAGVDLLDDTVSTKEGISLYQSVDDMKKVYGDDYKEENGVYTYTKGKTELVFMIKENKIVQIGYSAVHNK